MLLGVYPAPKWAEPGERDYFRDNRHPTNIALYGKKGNRLPSAIGWYKGSFSGGPEAKL